MKKLKTLAGLFAILFLVQTTSARLKLKHWALIQGLCFVTYNLVYLMMALASAFVVLLMVYGGIKIIGGGEMQSSEEGKSIVKNAIIGLIIVLIISGFGCYMAEVWEFPECVPCPGDPYAPPPAWSEYFPVRINITNPHHDDLFPDLWVVSFSADIFDGSPEFDCVWNFDDATPTVDIRTPVRSCGVNHLFNLSGKDYQEYNIHVTVTDAWDDRAKDSVRIYVISPDFIMVNITEPERDTRPLARGYAYGYTGFPVEFRAEIMSLNKPFRYNWTFNATDIHGGTTNDLFNVTNHTFDKPGLYEVTFEAVDSAGNYDNDTIKVFVKPGLCDSKKAHEFIHLYMDPEQTPLELWEFEFSDELFEEPFTYIPLIGLPTTECVYELTAYNYSSVWVCGIKVTKERPTATDYSTVVWVKSGVIIDGKKPGGGDAGCLAEDLGTEGTDYIYCPDCSSPGCEIFDVGGSSRCDMDDGIPDQVEDVMNEHYRPAGSIGNIKCGDNEKYCSNTCPGIGDTTCNCGLTVSDGSEYGYKPRYGILCGNDGRWYACTEPCCHGDFACDGTEWKKCPPGKCRGGHCV